MKTTLHKSDTRGFANHGWLQASHSFSFTNFYDPEKVHFGALRVLNDDIIAPKMGFGTHPHNNMEIITIPLKGVLKHRDNVHNDWQSVRPGEVQVMSAGTGVEHSEINGSQTEHLSLFQIWIVPNEQNVTPRYDQKIFDPNERKNKIQILVSSFEHQDSKSLKIHQDAVIARIELNKDKKIDYHLHNKRNGVYIMNISGVVEVDGKILESRDAIAVEDSEQFSIRGTENSDVLCIETPMIQL